MSAASPYRAPAAPPVDLGAPVSRHEQAKTLAGRIVGSLVFLGPAVAFGGKSIANGVPLWPAGDVGFVQAAFAVVYVVLPLLAATLIGNAIRHRHDHVAVYERGLLVRVMGHESRIPFTEILSLASRVVRTKGGVVHDHTVRWTGGVVKISHDHDRVEALVASLRERTLEVLLPKARLDHAAGRALAFGPLHLEATKLRLDEGVLPLTQLGRTVVAAGNLSIYMTNDEHWATLPASDVPNLHVLLALFGMIRGPATTATPEPKGA